MKEVYYPSNTVYAKANNAVAYCYSLKASGEAGNVKSCYVFSHQSCTSSGYDESYLDSPPASFGSYCLALSPWEGGPREEVVVARVLPSSFCTASPPRSLTHLPTLLPIVRQECPNCLCSRTTVSLALSLGKLATDPGPLRSGTSLPTSCSCLRQGSAKPALLLKVIVIPLTG